MKKTIGLILGLTLPLVACGGEESARTTANVPPAATDAAPQLRGSAAEDEVATVWANTYLADQLVATDQIGFEASDNGVVLMRVADGEEFSERVTSGARLHYMISDLSEGASTELNIAVTARALGDDVQIFRVAYTTNYKGNSGWQEFAVGNVFETVEFTYTIPAGEDPNGDFIGFTLDDGVEVEISEVRIY